MKSQNNEIYKGFEQGPIRPPSEANSLLIRLTRNCPWNHCAFCPVYKNQRFSLRPLEHILFDIDIINKYIKELISDSNGISQDFIDKKVYSIDDKEKSAFYAALNWYSNGMESIFLQDANSLIVKPENLIKILNYIKNLFPDIKRITSYARSHTITKIKDSDLQNIKKAGLNRIHIGLESGSDEVLKMVKKGSTKADHIKAGIKVKNAEIELSEYVMPGLGGQKYSEINATETADALNQINPDFIRIRTLAIPSNVPLWKMKSNGDFIECTDLMKTKELLIFIKSLSGIQSKIVSDHILNLFEDIDGILPDDKEKMVNKLNNFLNMDPQQQLFFQVGKRFGIVRRLDQINSEKAYIIENICKKMNINTENADYAINEIMQRFI